jgi:hypothetical protein
MNYAEPFFDNHYQDEPSRASSYEIGTPESARECPCDTCPNYGQCESDSKECVAFRNWYATGNYDDKDVERLLRKPKNL